MTRQVQAVALAISLLCLSSVTYWYVARVVALPTRMYQAGFLSRAESTGTPPAPSPKGGGQQPAPAGVSECPDNAPCPQDEPVYRLETVKRYPHDPKAYTQGLLYLGQDTLYESTGLYGRSSLRKVNLQTGEVLGRTANRRADFGEGLAYYKGFLWQLIWRKRTVYQYDPRTLELKGTFSMPQEFEYNDGWGLASTSDGASRLYAPEQPPDEEEHLYVTDSGTKLYQVDFSNGVFKLRDAVTIMTPDGHPLEMANELELIKEGEVWANIYGQDCIARVNPHTGRVLGWILADHFRQQEALGPEAEVFNGIAYDKAGNRLFVTGKLWSQLFEVRLAPDRTTPRSEVSRLCVPSANVFHPGRR